MDHDYYSAKEEDSFDYHCCCPVDGFAGKEKERWESFDLGNYQGGLEECSGLCSRSGAVPETLTYTFTHG